MHLKVIIPYFGQWPFWMPLFVRSCELNPSVSWVLITDCGEPKNCPKNVQVRHLSFVDYCEKVSSALGIKFSPKGAYKLCDIRPAFAEIHAEELEDATHWAFGDIDVVYGNLERYLEGRDTKEYDVLSMHARRLSGHLTIFRNSEDINSAYRRVENWKAIMQDPMHRAFDERGFSKIFLRHKNSPNFVRHLASIFDPWLRRAEFCEAYTTPNAKISWRDGTMSFPETWYWKNGRIWNDRDSELCYPYFHFMVWKKAWGALPCLDPEQVRRDALWAFSERGIERMEISRA